MLSQLPPLFCSGGWCPWTELPSTAGGKNHTSISTGANKNSGAPSQLCPCHYLASQQRFFSIIPTSFMPHLPCLSLPCTTSFPSQTDVKLTGLGSFVCSLSFPAAIPSFHPQGHFWMPTPSDPEHTSIHRFLSTLALAIIFSLSFSPIHPSSHSKGKT